MKMKYTFFYYNQANQLIYAGNCVDVNKVRERHKSECDFGYAQNGFDACFYKYIDENNLNWGDLRFESEVATIGTSDEVIKRYNPVCNKKIPTSSLTCSKECYVYIYSYNSQTLYVKSSFDVDKDHFKNKDNFENDKGSLYLFDYMRSKNIKFEDLELTFKVVKAKNTNELYEKEDEIIMEMLPICNTKLNCVRSNKDMFKDLHEDMIDKDIDEKMLKFKTNMRRKLITLLESSLRSDTPAAPGSRQSNSNHDMV